jgi:hypothetical protein
MALDSATRRRPDPTRAIERQRTLSALGEASDPAAGGEHTQLRAAPFAVLASALAALVVATVIGAMGGAES